MRRLNLLIKRILDTVLSLLGLIIISPIFLVLMVLIRVTSVGPVFFFQERLGYKGKVFKIIKFRTMVVNAENMGTGVVINEKSDPRITKIGKILRKTSLDELPQLINVIKGDMALVGPRPPVPYHPYDGYRNYPDWAVKRFEVKPGITGLAQVELKSDASWEERIVVDNKYVDRFSVGYDFVIILKTIGAVLKRETF
ncbi:MAG: sugar transferase [Eubacteriales bacterium]|nr:sugar transferase [Eubacteriales bacterium]